MSRSLYFKPHIEEKESSYKPVRFMDFIHNYYGTHAVIFTHKDVELLYALKAACDEEGIKEIIDMIEQFNAVKVEIRI